MIPGTVGGPGEVLSFFLGVLSREVPVSGDAMIPEEEEDEDEDDDEEEETDIGIGG